jgi:hypothetical protein
MEALGAIDVRGGMTTTWSFMSIVRVIAASLGISALRMSDSLEVMIVDRCACAV